MRKVVLIGIVLTVVLFSCQKEVEIDLNTPPTVVDDLIEQENNRLSAAITSQKTNIFLNGLVVDEQNQPLAQVAVSCGLVSTITDDKGFFYFKESMSVNKEYALIKVHKAGYMTGYRTFTPNSNKLAYHQEKIMLQKQNSHEVFSNSGAAIVVDKIRLSFPAAAVVKADGNSYSGDIHVEVRYIDPLSSGFPLMMPGALVGLNNSGDLNALQSFGMAIVELKDDSGNALKIAPGKKVKMEMAASAGGPASVPL